MTDTTRLTGADRRVLDRARELAWLPATTPSLREFTGEADPDMARGVALGLAKSYLGDLLAIIARLDGPPGGPAFCKQCLTVTASATCPVCGGPACKDCGRCPACDGDPQEDDHG